MGFLNWHFHSRKKHLSGFNVELNWVIFIGLGVMPTICELSGTKTLFLQVYSLYYRFICHTFQLSLNIKWVLKKKNDEILLNPYPTNSDFFQLLLINHYLLFVFTSIISIDNAQNLKCYSHLTACVENQISI